METAEKRDVRSMDFAELTNFISRLGEPAYRAGQVFSWVHKRCANSFGEMTDIPARLREALGGSLAFPVFEKTAELRSENGGATKFLYHIGKNTIIESVLMTYSFGNSVCVSTQAGCKMGCAFCASGAGGFDRNLSAGEILAQAYAAAGASRVTFMGCGEPLDNYANVLKAIAILTDPRGLGLGARHITLSTCGLVPEIYALAAENGGKGLQITLAVSLHAPNDGIRARLMPVAKTYGLDGLLKACAHYASVTGRRVTYEYALIDKINDTPACAGELGARLRNTLCHVNLILMNESAAPGLRKSGSAAAAAFSDILASYGVPCTLRRTLGSDVEGACGQLRMRHRNRVM
ncbi:MAG: 23S rRNA (adenine(2503)-C(2))-methyltransferase RlmN [Firmicutes bacterium]|nr:23S rRNA (adenine(2503)-C(2))-methyltransferase RlmN [Bacillota bacterium]